MKHRVTLSDKEIGMISHILRQLSDHTVGDDRPDHGLNNLKSYRKVSEEMKRDLYRLNGRFYRLYHKAHK